MYKTNNNIARTAIANAIDLGYFGPEAMEKFADWDFLVPTREDYDYGSNYGWAETPSIWEYSEEVYASLH